MTTSIKDKDMTANIVKLDCFDERHFLRWQKRVHHMLLTSLDLEGLILTPINDWLFNLTTRWSLSRSYERLEIGT